MMEMRGDVLDRWGAHMGVYRKFMELDRSYRERMMAKIRGDKAPPTIRLRILAFLHRIAVARRWRGVEIVLRHRIWAEAGR